ncbi:MAG TPA: hypothetical protein VMZ04_03245, partial [Anaerolineae bacterium]|nr:hypothetical protein [Anaerolineae bacterium]
WLDTRLKSKEFEHVLNSIPINAARQRKQVPVESLVFDLDQFPDEDWLPTWSAWGTHIYPTGNALYWNSLAYAFLEDRTAGEYAKDVLVTLSKFKNWTHPWQTKRGRFSEHRTGAWSHNLALAYDLTYDLMNEQERRFIRDALMKNIVMGAHKTYVVNNNVTCNTSNWIAHIAGGSLMVQAAMFGDGPDVETMEPYFTGAALKLYDFIEKVVDPDGAWGEGLGYNNYSFRTMCQSLPSLENVFHIDMSEPLDGSYKEYIWAGPVKEKKYFFFGDTGGNLNPITDWAWLLPKYKDPLLGWYYNALKYGVVESNTKASIRSDETYIQKNQTFMDVLYETEDTPRDDPFDEDPVTCFRSVGTTVFKSGWEPDDFVFVMRTGPFFNHQHLDQGSFWIADRGSIFLEERHGSTYYDDPLYQPWYTQPVGHSTILINGNHQSQRVGDPLVFAKGFEDYACIYHFLNGENTAFSSGDIGKLYWDKVKCLRRNVLYLKPRTILMLDTVVPGERDVDVTLLYQTLFLKDIAANENTSTITKNGNILYIKHLYPRHMVVKAVETPHYLYTLRDEKPLVKEGLLSVTARTDRVPLVVANLLTTTAGGEPNCMVEQGNGFIHGTAEGKRFAFSTRLNAVYDIESLRTDALAVTWDNSRIFAAMCTILTKDGAFVLESEKLITFEFSPDGLLYYHRDESPVIIGVQSKPSAVSVNGNDLKNFTYDAERKVVTVVLPAGVGLVIFK